MGEALKARSTANNRINTDFKGRSHLGLGLLPKMISFQLCAKRDITCVAGIPIKVL